MPAAATSIQTSTVIAAVVMFVSLMPISASFEFAVLRVCAAVVT